VISSKKGQVLRRFPTMSQEKAEHFAATMRQLSLKARSVVRDLDPPVRHHPLVAMQLRSNHIQ
jgi:dynein light chain roadblock-type